MRVVKLLAGSCLLVLCQGSIGQAGFKDNFAQWNELDSYAKSMYVQGAFDRMTGFSFLGEPEWAIAVRDAFTKCGLDLKLNARMLNEAVTKHYQDNPDDWGVPPHYVLDTVVTRVCHKYINDERSKYNLEPWKPRTGSISSQLK